MKYDAAKERKQATALILDALKMVREAYWRMDTEETSKAADGTWTFSAYTDSGENSDPLTFAELDKVSALFKTSKINFLNEERSSGYCETCWESWDALVLRVSGAVLPGQPKMGDAP